MLEPKCINCKYFHAEYKEVSDPSSYDLKCNQPEFPGYLIDTKGTCSLWVSMDEGKNNE